MRYLVQAFNEPRGEGGGWEMCADNVPGALFFPCELEDDDAPDAEPIIIGNAHRTRVAADDELAELEAHRELDSDPAVEAAAMLSKSALLDAAREGQELGQCDED